MFFMSCVCHAFASVHCCLVVTCWETADLLALVCDVCVFVTFPCGILGQVLYLIVSIPVLCHLSYYIANSMDPDQTAPGAWGSLMFVSMKRSSLVCNRCKQQHLLARKIVTG